MRNLVIEEVKNKWPKLGTHNYRDTSHATPKYNCMAFANGDERHKWECGRNGGRFYWPDGLGDSLDDWCQIFVRQGFSVTDNRAVEVGYDKVAIYVDGQNDTSHVAITSGDTWKSKLGNYQDISHDTLDLLEGYESCEYGRVAVVLRRKAVLQ